MNDNDYRVSIENKINRVNYLIKENDEMIFLYFNKTNPINKEDVDAIISVYFKASSVLSKMKIIADKAYRDFLAIALFPKIIQFFIKNLIIRRIDIELLEYYDLSMKLTNIMKLWSRVNC